MKLLESATRRIRRRLARMQKKELKKFIDFIVSRVRFALVICNDINMAYTTFKSLNARGKDLDASDHLKAHLVYTAAQGSERDALEQRFGENESLLGQQKMTKIFSCVLSIEKLRKKVNQGGVVEAFPVSTFQERNVLGFFHKISEPKKAKRYLEIADTYAKELGCFVWKGGAYNLAANPMKQWYDCLDEEDKSDIREAIDRAEKLHDQRKREDAVRSKFSNLSAYQYRWLCGDNISQLTYFLECLPSDDPWMSLFLEFSSMNPDLSIEEKENFLRGLERFIFCQTLKAYHQQEQEAKSRWADLATAVVGDPPDLGKIFQALTLTDKEKEFVRNCILGSWSTELYSPEFLKYVLIRQELKVEWDNPSGEESKELSKFTVDEIRPKTSSKNSLWTRREDWHFRQGQAAASKLGNLALVEKAHDFPTRGEFQDKKMRYERSKLRQTRDIAGYDTFSYRDYTQRHQQICDAMIEHWTGKQENPSKPKAAKKKAKRQKKTTEVNGKHETSKGNA